MRLEQLRYLSDIQYTNSISKTAIRFFLSQQSLSNNIRQLEKELGVVLLERSPFGVVLTKDARALLELSDPFLRQYDELQNQFALQRQADSEDSLKHIKILNSSALTSIVLPKAIAIFSKRHPRVRISIKEIPYRDVFPAVIDRTCNVAFLSINEEYFLSQLNQLEDSEAIHHNIMLTDRLVACVPAHSPLAEKEMVEQSDIMTRPFTYLNIVPLVKNKSGYSNLALYTSNNIEFHRRILQEMDVVSLMPRYVYVNLFESKHAVAKPLEGAQQIIYHATLYPDATPDPFVKELANIVASLL